MTFESLERIAEHFILEKVPEVQRRLMRAWIDPDYLDVKRLHLDEPDIRMVFLAVAPTAMMQNIIDTEIPYFPCFITGDEALGLLRKHLNFLDCVIDYLCHATTCNNLMIAKFLGISTTRVQSIRQPLTMGSNCLNCNHFFKKRCTGEKFHGRYVSCQNWKR